ncbi:B3 domain-containing protein Os01g0234100-like isoform X1 [Euphorbia lathyris]|uniref:B3 domain-containing protein Os01g0234100-like isoform X1 n=1 Tax=Euphorbia lathyris TaxID=212925 RepID=UPI0033139009
MAEELKNVSDEANFNRTSPLTSEYSKSPGEEDLTLAQLSHPPIPKLRLTLPASSSSVMEKTEKRVRLKRRYSDSKIKHANTAHAGKCICCRQNKPAIDRMTSPGQNKSASVIRAEEVQSNLESAFPSFVKCLVRSHVGSCFWMGLPGPFCRAHLPREDSIVTLEDECGKDFQMRYIAYKTGLSAGWRQFAVAHQLLEGDALVFQYIDSCKFKVYIIRANNLTEVDGALGLLTLDPQIKQNDAEDTAEINLVPCKSARRKRPRSLPLAVVQKKNKKSRSRLLISKNADLAEQSEDDSEEVGSEVLEGVKFSSPGVQIEDVKSFENFNIVVDGVILDSEISEDIRTKYYNLCCSQNTLLHGNLIRGINCKLIAGIISEIVNISDAIRVCNFSTSRDEFDTWDKSLRASEHFGINVGFLRDRLSKLVKLAYDSEGAAKTRRYIEATTERVQTEDEIQNLEAKLAELKAAREKFGADIESLKSKVESYELKFQEEVLSPW